MPEESLSGEFQRKSIYRLAIIQTVASGCCELIAQCVMVLIMNVPI